MFSILFFELTSEIITANNTTRRELQKYTMYGRRRVKRKLEKCKNFSNASQKPVRRTRQILHYSPPILWVSKGDRKLNLNWYDVFREFYQSHFSTLKKIRHSSTYLYAFTYIKNESNALQVRSCIDFPN